ncbi:NnrS family protein [Uliginosibacterium gangwonense]|uniref:NnrS family protein n=1 Tax=Uliginosibacterium gangwonense TaxID=392736 RepID=UPI000363F1E2|nr:NnrS family protein [Uliginosibacterium gangwonense]
MAVIPIDEPRLKPNKPVRGFALFALGFRPFYLLGATLAALFVPLWLMIALGGPAFSPALPALFWHAHEMIFGFATAIIVGFLLTAARNWTGLATPTGGKLAALVGVWLAGRIAMLCLPALAAAVIDLAFLPLAALVLARVLIRAGSRRNYFVLLILALLSVSNLLFHAAANAWLALPVLNTLHAAVALIATLATVIAGRIVPSFTANALKTVPRQSALLDRLAIGSTALTLLLWACGVSGIVVALISVLAAASQAWRSLGWRPGPTWRVPLLWILHISHAWLVLALLAAASAALGLPGSAAVLHLLTVGMISGLILGMITRTALGHTGRLLRAGYIEAAAYSLLQLAVLARILPVLMAPDWYRAGLMLAGTAWSLAFGLYLVRYAPILIQPRIDGREG